MIVADTVLEPCSILLAIEQATLLPYSSVRVTDIFLLTVSPVTFSRFLLHRFSIVVFNVQHTIRGHESRAMVSMNLIYFQDANLRPVVYSVDLLEHVL